MYVLGTPKFNKANSGPQFKSQLSKADILFLITSLIRK